MLADVSAMIMSLELRRHFTHTSFFKAFFTTCSHIFPYSLVLNVRALTPCILTPSVFYGTCHKTQSKINGHPSIDRNSRRGHPLVNKIQYINVYFQLKYRLLI